MAHLKHHAEDYILYHQGNEEVLKQSIVNFFKSRNYNTDVLDILVKIFADALFVNIMILKNTNRFIEEEMYTPSQGKAVKTVFIQFNSSGLQSLLNHYNTVTLQ